MLLGIDHVVLAVQDVDAASAELAAALGLEEDGGGDHPDWGTRNRILWLGNTFLELLGIADPVAASTSWLGRPVVDALATGPGMVAWAIASDSLEEDAGRLRERGAQLGPAIPGRRRRADGRLVRWDLSLPTRVGLAAPFLIEHHQGSAEWTPSERAVREAMPARLTAIELPISGLPYLPSPLLRLGSQLVQFSSSATPPTVSITGLASSVGVTSLLGCIWVPERGLAAMGDT